MKFQPSAIAATNLSGKSGGTVATITNTFRRKSNPRNPRTTQQTASRAGLAYLAGLWGSLTEDQQNSWIAAAPNNIRMKHGEVKKESGFNYFMRVNRPMVNNGYQEILTYVSKGPLPEGPGPTINRGITSMGIDTINYRAVVTYPWNTTPQTPWKEAFLWTGWIKPSRYSYPRPTRKIVSQSPGPLLSGFNINFDGEDGQNIQAPGPNYKAQVIERYINIDTGQELIFNTHTIRVADYTEQYNPIGIVIEAGATEVTMDGDEILYVQNFEVTEGSLETDEWPFYIKWTGWSNEGEEPTGPMDMILPNTAVTVVDPTHFYISWGPDPGMGPAPEEFQGASFSVGFKQDNSGQTIAFGPYGAYAEL